MANTPKGSYHPKRKCWYVTLWGKQRTLAKGPKKATEKAAKAELQRLIAEGPPKACEPGVIPAITLDLLAKYFLDYVRKELAPLTYTNYRRQINPFVLHAGRKTHAHTIQPKHITAWIATKQWGPSSRCIAISVLKAWYNWAEDQGHLATNPIVKVKRVAAMNRELVLNSAQADAVFAATTEPEFRDLQTAFRETGCRPGEIYTLSADRVNIEEGTWKVKNKTRRRTGELWRTVYLSPTAITLSARLLRYRQGKATLFVSDRMRAWNDHVVANRFVKIRKPLGYGKEVTAYAYRHLYATEALMRGVPPATVAELMGHGSTKMVMRIYNKLRKQTDHLREAARIARAA